MKEIVLQPTMSEKFAENQAWCASFALVWKEFEEKFLDENYFYNQKNELVKNLVEEGKKNIKINEKDCYVKSGKMTKKTKKEIEKAIKKKFKTKSDLLNQLEFEKDENTNRYILYSIIMFALEFPHKFQKFSEKHTFGDSAELVKYFGIEQLGAKADDLYDQVAPLFYNNEKEFAVSVETKEDKDILLFRTDEKLTFQDAFEKLKEKSKQKSFVKINHLAVPNLNVDIFKCFEELSGEKFVRKSDNQDFNIDSAIQTLKFELNNEGAKVKSEAVMTMVAGAMHSNVVKRQDFLFNDTFYLFIVEDESPIVALRIHDIDLFAK